MSNDNELAQKGSYTDLDDKELAATLAASGYFDDSKKTQAMTKVLAGREMGFGPVTSLKNIHFVDGGIEIGGQLIASKIRQSEKYDYRIDEHTDEICTITITDAQGEDIGSVTWDIERAENAGLTGKHNWKKYPRNMLFNRAISDARRFHCPDVMETGPYTPGEIPSNGSEQRAASEAESSNVEEANYEVAENGEEQDDEETVDMTDAARELAKSHGFDPSDIDGTGDDGRVLKSDVKDHLDDLEEQVEDEIEETETTDPRDDETVNMPDVMDQLGELVDDTPASLPDVKATLEKHGYTRGNLKTIEAYLTSVSAGDKDYETNNGVITLD